MDGTAAELMLKGTFSADKNEILFSKFGINYNNELEIFKKGSVIFRDYELAEPEPLKRKGEKEEEEGSSAVPEVKSKSQLEKEKKARTKAKIVVEHLDIIRDEFWERRPWLLSGKPGKVRKEQKS